MSRVLKVRVKHLKKSSEARFQSPCCIGVTDYDIFGRSLEFDFKHNEDTDEKRVLQNRERLTNNNSDSGIFERVLVIDPTVIDTAVPDKSSTVVPNSFFTQEESTSCR